LNVCGVQSPRVPRRASPPRSKARCKAAGCRLLGAALSGVDGTVPREAGGCRASHCPGDQGSVSVRVEGHGNGQQRKQDCAQSPTDGRTGACRFIGIQAHHSSVTRRCRSFRPDRSGADRSGPIVPVRSFRGRDLAARTATLLCFPAAARRRRLVQERGTCRHSTGGDHERAQRVVWVRGAGASARGLGRLRERPGGTGP